MPTHFECCFFVLRYQHLDCRIKEDTFMMHNTKRRQGCGGGMGVGEGSEMEDHSGENNDPDECEKII